MIPIAIFSFKYADFMREIAKKISAQKALMSTIADESLSNIRTVKAFANEEEEISKFNKYSTDVYKLGFHKSKMMAFFSFFT
jgi:ABC-type multidrug transport system fused ATPase/permease subunit